MADTPETLLALPSYTAGADLSSDDGRFVRLEADGDVIRMTDGTIATAQRCAGVVPIGGGAASGERVTVVPFGRTKMLAGDTLTRATHGPLTSDSAGRAIPATAGTQVLATWVSVDDRDAVVNDYIDVLVHPNGVSTGTITGSLGATDNSLVRTDGAGGATIQGTGANATLTDAGALTLAAALTVSAGGAAITGNSTITGTLGSLTGLTLASGNITLSGAGATVDGVDLDTAIRGALGATDNSIMRVDGAGGVTAQGSGANATISDAGALTLASSLTVTAGGATITAGDVTVTAGNIVMSAGGATVDGIDLTATVGAMRVVTLAAAAEAANAIDVTLNVVNLAGAAQNEATKVVCRAYSPSATTITLSEQGAGSTSFVTAADIFPTIVITTDANGDAVCRVAFADAGTVGFTAEVAPASGASTFGAGARSLELVFA